MSAGIRSIDDSPLDTWNEFLAAQKVLSSATAIAMPCFMSGAKYLCPSFMFLNVRLFPFFSKEKIQKNFWINGLFKL